MKKLTFLVLCLLMSSVISKAGSGSCSTSGSSAQCSGYDYNNSDNTYYITTSGNLWLHGWGTVSVAPPDNGYVFLEAVWSLLGGPCYSQHWDISYDSSSSDAQSYGSQIDFYRYVDNATTSTTLYICARTSNGANGGISVSW